MVSKRMYELGSCRSEIRELFEYGLKRKAEIGAENVFDFSLGNPSVPAPECVKEALTELVTNTDPVALHGYTSAQGAPDVRKACADYVNASFGTNYTGDNFYMTVGAAASLTISLSAIAENGGEVIVLAPFFPEYTVFITQAGMTPVIVKCREEDFQVDFDALEKAINSRTKAIIINSPNNPSGVVFSLDTIKKLCEVMDNAQKKYGKDIYIIADEPYRELVYTDGVTVPFIPNYYNNTIVCYSFSKSLSLPGERIGYVLVPDTANDWQSVYFAVCGAGRSLGYVCAPSLFQQVIKNAIKAGNIVQNNFNVMVQNGLDFDEALKNARASRVIISPKKESKPISVALVGHGYNIYDKRVCMDIAKKLDDMDVQVYNAYQLTQEQLEGGLNALNTSLYWANQYEMTGCAGHYFQEEKIDGVITVTAFGCGPDSLMLEDIRRKAKNFNKPLLNLTIDEHTGEAGFITRLEAFCDMLYRKKRAKILKDKQKVEELIRR